MLTPGSVSLDSRGQAAVQAALCAGMSDVITAYLRWHQIETWLRQLVHLELSANYGRSWSAHLRSGSAHRAKRTSVNAYTLSPDEASLLFYEDVAALFSLIEDQWKFFEHALVAKVRWLEKFEQLWARSGLWLVHGSE